MIPLLAVYHVSIQSYDLLHEDEIYLSVPTLLKQLLLIIHPNLIFKNIYIFRE